MLEGGAFVPAAASGEVIVRDASGASLGRQQAIVETGLSGPAERMMIAERVD